MKRMIQEYGLIIVVICLILLMLSFSTGAMGKSIMTDIGDKADKMTKLPKWASVTDTEEVETSSTLIDGSSFRNLVPSETTAIIFTANKAPEGVKITDVSAAKDKGIVAWLDGTTWYVSSQSTSKTIEFAENCLGMFACTYNNQPTGFSVQFNTTIDTSNVKNMEIMFANNKTIETVDLSQFNTSSVTRMEDMFASCTNLKQIDISNFDTASIQCEYFSYAHKCTGMDSLFQYCSSLTSVKLPKLTSNITTLDYMFWYCTSLTTVDISCWDLSNVEFVNTMFSECSNLRMVYANNTSDVARLTQTYSSINFSTK